MLLSMASLNHNRCVFNFVADEKFFLKLAKRQKPDLKNSMKQAEKKFIILTNNF